MDLSSFKVAFLPGLPMGVGVAKAWTCRGGLQKGQKVVLREDLHYPGGNRGATAQLQLQRQRSVES